VSQFTIGLVQDAVAPNRPAAVRHAIDRIRDAAARGAQIVCLPEMFNSPYFCTAERADRFDLAEPIPGPTSEELCKVAAARKVVIVASLFEKRTEGIYHNTAVIIDADGKIAGKYRKMHIPDDPRYYEKYYFTPGDLDFTAHPTAKGKMGALVCWDQWFPEAARLTAMAGAQVLFYPTAIGWWHGETANDRKKMLEAWITIQRSHAIANGVFVAVTNRVGVEDDLEFWGNSFVADPFGEIIAQADAKSEDTLIVECDLGKIERTRRNWPFLRDRRIDAYQDLTRRYRS
jgi:N-carbamoylputrescine amidase